MKGTFRKIGNTAVPAGRQGHEALAAVKDGHVFVADVRAVRNPDQLELFWVLCGVVADADDDDKENVKKWLLRKLNLVDVWFDPDGAMFIDTKSIAFESMEQATFSRFMDASINLMSERLNTAPAEFRKRFEELLDPVSRELFKRYGHSRKPPVDSPSITPAQQREDA